MDLVMTGSVMLGFAVLNNGFQIGFGYKLVNGNTSLAEDNYKVVLDINSDYTNKAFKDFNSYDEMVVYIDNYIKFCYN